MSEVVTVTDNDGNTHWTAAGSTTHQRYRADDEPDKTQEAPDAPVDAPPADPNPATVDDEPGDREDLDTAPSGGRGTRKG